MTLLEVLAAFVVIGLISVVLASSPFLRRHVTLDESAMVSRMASVEHRARLASVGQGGRLRIQETTWWIETANGPGSFLSEPVEFLEPCDLRVLVDGRPVDRIIYDSRGRSADVAVILWHASDERRIWIDGLTGTWSGVPSVYGASPP
jgi:type II secretory pathway pseudopilin PulG